MAERDRVRLGVLLLLVLAVALVGVAARLRGVALPGVVAAASFVPGGALALRLGVPDLLTAAALALGLSLTLDTLAALAATWAGWWHPAALAAILGGAAAALILADLAGHARAWRRR